MIVLGLGAALIAGATLVALALLIDIEAARPAARTRVF